MALIFLRKEEYIKRSILYFIYTLIFIIFSICINNFFALLYGTEGFPFEMLAPMVEEAFRFFSVALGSPINWMFTTIFAIHEYCVYINRIDLIFGYVPFSLVMMRLVCVGTHFILLFIQLYGWKLSKKLNKRRYFYISYFIAVLFHILWNTKYSMMVFFTFNKIF